MTKHRAWNSTLSQDPEKVRAWKDRSRKEIPRNVEMNPYNRERKARLYERNFGDKAVWIRTLPCHVTRRYGVDPAHVVQARGMGGCGGDKTGLVPLVREVHDDFDEVLTDDQFRAKWGMTKDEVRAAAKDYEELWEAYRRSL